MRNAFQSWQHVEELQWPMHVEGLWTHIANNKKLCELKRTIEDDYNGLNTRSKKGVETRMKTTIIHYGKGNEIIS